MSILLFNGRPWVVFDAHNRQHRQWFADFQRTCSWGHCPVRFISDDAAGDLLTMIQRRLIAYYTAKEFGSRKKLQA
jgi:hypothetical protein